jgi:hypothetical protein
MLTYCTYFVTANLCLASEELRAETLVIGERRGAYRALVGKPEGRRPLGRPRRRWEDNIKMDLREV